MQRAQTCLAARNRLLADDPAPLFLADWNRVLFIHFSVDPEILQSATPFALDLRDGRAYVSLVAFTMDRFRPAFGAPLTTWMFWPVRCHHFLNLRTYVRVDGDPGIVFLREWISQPLCVPLGGPLFGLPYRWGAIDYHRAPGGSLHGSVAAKKRRLLFKVPARDPERETAAAPDTLDEFLLERYAAFTACGGKRRRFRIWHEPWKKSRVDVELPDTSLLWAFPWFNSCQPAGAHYSPGASDIWMGYPHRLTHLERDIGGGQVICKPAC